MLYNVMFKMFRKYKFIETFIDCNNNFSNIKWVVGINNNILI